MKILTLNCHSWQEENQIDKLKYLAKIIKENNYDVVGLQEVSQLIKSNIIFENVKKDNFMFMLVEELKNLGCYEYDFKWDYSHIGYDIYEEGIGILTKHKIKNFRSFFISNSTNLEFWKTRKIVNVDIEYKDKIYSVYSCHLGWWEDKEEPFKNQVDKLMKQINKDKTSIILGDFNNDAFMRNHGYDYIISREFYDTHTLAEVKDNGATVKGNIAGWEENSKYLRLDLILVNEQLEVKYSRVIFNDKNKKIISDHFGVEVQIE